jgi:DNA mismatch endonuclease, patch repair protein
MKATPPRDTSAELRIRKQLHAKGLRYSVDAKPLRDSSRRADLVFRKAKVAVFVDGCFWHGCPEHATWPKANKEFWRIKLLANRARDADTNNTLRSRGWSVIRVWEHDDPERAARKITQLVRARVKSGREKKLRAE